MTTPLTHERKQTDGLSTEEQRAWDQLMLRRVEEYEGEMARALFDDVRPAWEAHLAGTQTAPRRIDATPEHTADEELTYGMMRALFDDVRPDWEAHLARQARKAA